MNIFKFRENIKKDYLSFVNSYLDIDDTRIADHVQQNQEVLFPDALLSFNPAYKHGNSIEQLCNEGVLHKELEYAFQGYDLFQHQEEAIRLGSNKENFIVTSGTGSGKSLTYIASIFHELLTSGSGEGIKAVIVYPMNALINSQYKEIEKYKNNFEENSSKSFPITFEKYTGQEKDTERTSIMKNPPDILLTNYMMLELIMTRQTEIDKHVRNSIIQNVEFLVLDELHTFRGRQGADVAMLIRRITALAKNNVRYFGTSATMATADSKQKQKVIVADFANQLFGCDFEEKNVIGEYIQPCFDRFNSDITANEIKEYITGFKPDELNIGSISKDTFGTWLEKECAIKEISDGLSRRKPFTYREILNKLVKSSSFSEERCFTFLDAYLNKLAVVNTLINEKNKRYLPYKFHQFISQTGSIYISLEDKDSRQISFEPLSEDIPLYPIVFSRLSGVEFLCVRMDEGSFKILPREFKDVQDEDDQTSGYILTESENITYWDSETQESILPDKWFKENKKGRSIIKEKENRLPKKIYYDKFGNFSFEKGNHDFSGWFIPAPLLVDPTSGIIYETNKKESTKLVRLGGEGKSTSTTVLSYLVLKQMKASDLQKEELKLLSFSDVRQDASLQSGHFNDFIRMLSIRSAMVEGLKKEEKITFARIDSLVFENMNLDPKEYANYNSDSAFGQRDNQDAMRSYLMYQIILDLKLENKYILPNLENCALLDFDFKDLSDFVADKYWKNIPIFEQMSPDARDKALRQILNYFRKHYALHSETYLTEIKIEEHVRTINERLKEYWRIDKKESALQPNALSVAKITARTTIDVRSLRKTSQMGKFLIKIADQLGIDIRENYNDVAEKIFDTLTEAHWLERTELENREGDVEKIYQLKLDALIWKKGDEKNIFKDETSVTLYKDFEFKPNLFFQDLYSSSSVFSHRIQSAEHTGQVNNEDRKNRERDFRTGELNVLYCSPTMELGIDISELSVVHMRNVPPNPANYVQRSGRAGRSGQSALVLTFCASTSSHDRYYFNNQREMVSGTVAAPKLDLLNEELITSHLHSLLLSKLSIHELTNNVLDLFDDTLNLKESVEIAWQMSDDFKMKSLILFNKVLESILPLLEKEKPSWYVPEWVKKAIQNAFVQFINALERWKRLYNSTQQQIREANEVIESGRYTNRSQEMKDAERKRRFAIAQRDLLTNSNTEFNQSEFYPYRYLASEGFLPGYNFPRLPIRAFIPIGNAGDYISRQRFVALGEYSPESRIYHNGNKYRIYRLSGSEFEGNLVRAKISKNSGYLLTGDQFNFERCPFSKVDLSENSNREILTNLLHMSDVETRPEVRITCDEEDRTRQSYDIDIYFSNPAGEDNLKKALIRADDEDFMKLSYIPTAKIYKINRKWRRSEEQGFILGMTTGIWRSRNFLENENRTEEAIRVKLYVEDTANALYLEPIESLDLDAAGVITLQYALKRAIEEIFQVESNELAVTQIGDPEHPNILIYENAQGSLGVLAQFIDKVDLFKQCVEKAYEICRFNDSDYTLKASYDDLLSYYNQKYHQDINRYLIKDALNKLSICNVEIQTRNDTNSYDEHYNIILRSIDPDSSTELKFLKALYSKGLRLPDDTQKTVEGIYSRPDFYYEPGVWVFCDGTPHDNLSQKEKDNETRAAIMNKGFDVITYYYKDDLEELFEKRKDVFRKVK